jgi:hypothetical protein
MEKKDSRINGKEVRKDIGKTDKQRQNGKVIVGGSLNKKRKTQSLLISVDIQETLINILHYGLPNRGQKLTLIVY